MNHSNEYSPDPERKWKRKNYDESKSQNLPVREQCEIETDRDLDKPLEQLKTKIREQKNQKTREEVNKV